MKIIMRLSRLIAIVGVVCCLVELSIGGLISPEEDESNEYEEGIGMRERDRKLKRFFI
jgi:hypothetical protein